MAVIGSTGSGKTQLAIYFLSAADFTRRPWIIFDFKGDELIEAIGPVEISIRGGVPKKPGLYVVRPIPGKDDDAVEDFLWKVWEQERVGIYIDEGFMIGNRNAAFNACLTQGRSKRIQMIVLSQRPVWMSKFTFSEANYYAVMNLTIKDDRDFVSTYCGGHRINLLPKFHWLWYDVEGQRGEYMKPVPDRATLLAVFEERLQRRPKAI